VVYSVQARLRLSALKANITAQAIETFCSTRSKWGSPVVRRETDLQGNPVVVVNMRFTSKADQTAVANLLSTNADALSGSRVVVHACNHDKANPSPCSPDMEWTV
jgi:hypothetical protein